MLMFIICYFVRVIVFDISKAFDKVWYRGLLFKLEEAGICENLLSWCTDYLLNRHQRVVLPGATSPLSAIRADVLQCSLLGPLFLLVYINDITCNIGSNSFADDTSIFIAVENPD